MKRRVKGRPYKLSDHIIRDRTVRLSDFMVRQLKELSLKYGKNRNNQITLCHSLQVAALKLGQRKRIDTKTLYPTINH